MNKPKASSIWADNHDGCQYPAGRYSACVLKPKNSGFTLIELVVVIVILGILAATALPKFVDLTADATRAKVDALAGSFQTAVSLGNAVWGVKAAGTYMNDLPGYSDSTVDFNSSGFPVGTSFGPTSGPPAVSSSDCANLWNAILLSPPTVSTSASGTEWQAQGNVVTKKCIYTYLTVVTPARSITYDAGVGAVTKINP